ncbi:hypothetical protein N9L52_06135 [Litoricolaceae bacterium]|nr:hypothetical protein [Litorivicinaceae bacterium]
MINRVLGSGKFTLTALIIVLVLSKVANAQGGNSRDDNFTDCDEIQVLRIPPLPSCRGTTQLKQNPQWVVVVMSSYIPYMAIDVPVSRVYGPERLSRFGPYSDRADCIQATENPDNPVLNNYYEYMGYYVECWALDKWISYRVQWREKTKIFFEKMITDLRLELANIEHDGHRKLLLRQIRDTENLLKDELRER